MHLSCKRLVEKNILLKRCHTTLLLTCQRQFTTCKRVRSWTCHQIKMEVLLFSHLFEFLCFTCLSNGSLNRILTIYLLGQFWALRIQQQIKVWFQKYGQMGIQLSDWVENIVGKGEIASYEQFLLFPQCFQKLLFMGQNEYLWSKGLNLYKSKVCLRRMNNHEPRKEFSEMKNKWKYYGERSLRCMKF